MANIYWEEQNPDKFDEIIDLESNVDFIISIFPIYDDKEREILRHTISKTPLKNVLVYERLAIGDPGQGIKIPEIELANYSMELFNSIIILVKESFIKDFLIAFAKESFQYIIKSIKNKRIESNRVNRRIELFLKDRKFVVICYRFNSHLSYVDMKKASSSIILHRQSISRKRSLYGTSPIFIWDRKSEEWVLD